MLGRSLTRADLVITTPEKWDSMTRQWSERGSLMVNAAPAAVPSVRGSTIPEPRWRAQDTIELVLVDEIHMLGDDRGAVLEGMITRSAPGTRHIRASRVSHARRSSPALQVQNDEGIQANLERAVRQNAFRRAK